MLRNLLLATTAVALPIAAAHAQSQSQMDAIAASVMAQVAGDNVPECGMNGTGTCYPITMQPGDALPNSGSVTDRCGNVWSLVVYQAEDGSGHWYGGMTLNGADAWGPGYGAALRVINGTVYYEEAKGSGWRVEPATCDQSTLSNWQNWNFVGGDPGQGTGGGQAAVPADPASAPAQPVQTAAAPAPDPAQPSQPAQTVAAASSGLPLAPTGQSDGGQGCPGVTMAGAVTPGSGSFSDAAGNTYAIDANNGDVASANGAPINSGAYQTSQLAQGSDGNIYGQDENSHQWFELMGSGGDTWWQPLASVPAAIMSAGLSPATVANSPGANPCSSGVPQTASGQQNPASGVLSDILQVCANPATIANPTNADLCSKAFANQALLDQIGAQLAAAQQAGPK
jgi:hypothetical protein